MKPAEYISYDGLGLAELIRDGGISREEVLACALLQLARQLEQAAPWPLNAPLLGTYRGRT